MEQQQQVSQNQVHLLGNLGQEIELRETANGKKMARTSLATNEIKTINGQHEKVTTWHNLIAWGATAEDMSRNLQKGQKVFIEGKIQYRTYETKTGEKRYTTDILVNTFRKIAKEESAA